MGDPGEGVQICCSKGGGVWGTQGGCRSAAAKCVVEPFGIFGCAESANWLAYELQKLTALSIGCNWCLNC